MVWATAATRNATTWLHMDDHGMATVVKIVAGMKYWVVSREKCISSTGIRSDIGSSKVFLNEGMVWEVEMANDALWDHEGILLKAGDILYYCSALAVTDD
jgi:hypothetical protein